MTMKTAGATLLVLAACYGTSNAPPPGGNKTPGGGNSCTTEAECNDDPGGARAARDMLEAEATMQPSGEYGTHPPPPSDSQEISARQKECEAKLAAMGLEHGKDSCKPKPPASPLADEVQDLPNKCVADSPRDKPCSSYGGAYKIRLEPDPAQPASCFNKAVETVVRLKASTKYGDRRDLSWELGGLLKALNVRDKAPRLGSAVRDGVCCVDIDVSEEVKGKFMRVVIKLASGATVVNAKASVGCDDSGDRARLKVQVTRTND